LIQRGNSFTTIGIIVLLVLLSTVSTFGADNPVVAQNIEFVNADLRAVFYSLAEAGKFNVVMEPAVHGDVTLTLKNGVTIKDAVAVIAKTYGYSFRWLNDSPTAVIGSANFIKLNFDHKSSKVFQLKFADPTVVAESLEVVIPKNRIKADSKTNQITVMASDIEIANMAEIIAGLDREMPMINIEAKLEEVTDQFWKEIGVDNTFSSPHMGVYLLSEQQLKAIVENPKINLLTKPNLTGLDNHEAKIFIGDKVPIITEKNKQGDINYKVEYVDTGTSLSVTPRINADNQLTLMVKIAVSTIANKSQPGTNWTPWVVTREFESTIRLEAGQAFLLSGLLERSEYQMMKDSPYEFPILRDLFTKENPFLQTVPKSQTEVVIILTPRLIGKVAIDTKTEPKTAESTVQTIVAPDTAAASGTTVIADQNPVLPGANGQSEQTNVALNDKLPIDEEKPEVKITGTKQPESDLTKGVTTPNAINASIKFTEIKYQVKKGDSLAKIVRKFSSVLQIIVGKNKLGKTGTIKPNTVLIIPVPNERIYTLKPKETLWRIAKRYGTTLEVLKDLNGIIDETKVKAGQELVLPVPVSKIANHKF
jgi:type II secretory pathway component GspD/PulD (secretin)